MRRFAALFAGLFLVVAGSSRAQDGATKDPALEEARSHVQ